MRTETERHAQAISVSAVMGVAPRFAKRLHMVHSICFEHTTDACGRAVLTNPRRFEIAVPTASDPETWCIRDTDVHFALVGHGRYRVSDWQPPMTIPDDFRIGMVVTEKTWYGVLWTKQGTTDGIDNL